MSVSDASRLVCCATSKHQNLLVVSPVLLRCRLLCLYKFWSCVIPKKLLTVTTLLRIAPALHLTHMSPSMRSCNAPVELMDDEHTEKSSRQITESSGEGGASVATPPALRILSQQVSKCQFKPQTCRLCSCPTIYLSLAGSVTIQPSIAVAGTQPDLTGTSKSLRQNFWLRVRRCAIARHTGAIGWILTRQHWWYLSVLHRLLGYCSHR